MANDLESHSASSEATPLVAKKSSHESPTVLQDAKSTITLGIPIFFSMLSFTGMKTTDSALLGHVSADALAAASLSDLWTMCTVVFLQAGVLSVLCSAAVGAGNPKLAGIYLQVSYAVLTPVVLLVAICWCLTENIWLALGAPSHLAAMAGTYAKILAFSLPLQLAGSQLRQFFSSQMIMHPEANASIVALIVNLVFGLFLVLGIPVPNWNGFGFIACPWVTTSAVGVQFLLIVGVYCGVQKLHANAWGGWAWKEITRERVSRFLHLYVPAALGSASDFWRVAVIGLVAADLGANEVAVFNTSYRIMWIVLIMVNSTASASAIKTTLRLGKMDTAGAKQSSHVGVYMACAIISVVGLLVYCKMDWFGKIFTSDQGLLDLFTEVKLPLVMALVTMNLSVALERIPYSMGRTKEVFWYGFVASWCFQVPGVYFCTYHWRKDLYGLYTGMAVGYTALAILYGIVVLRSDWNKYALEARERSEMPAVDPALAEK